MKNRFLNLAKIAAIAFVMVLLFVFATKTDDNKQQQDFEQYYKIYSLSLPANTTFCKQAVPLHDEEILERYDRELLTNVYWQSQTILLIKRAHKFFPVIEKILAQEGIPDDMKYLALAESGLQNVVSPAGAAGYWQMLDATAKIYGLEINPDVDERYHLTKSTLAACKYFKEAYGVFNDWALVAASYNMGIDGVRKQLQQQGANSYYDLWLNTETSRYVFRILAIKHIIEQPKKYGFNIIDTHKYKLPKCVVVKIVATTPDLIKLSQTLGCSYKSIKTYNPWLRTKQLTITNKPYYLSVPYAQISNNMQQLIQNDTLTF